MAINKIVLNTDKGEQTLVDLTGDTVTADKMIVGTIAHDKSGEKITGTNPYELEATNTEVQTQTDLIEQIQNALVGKALGGGESTPTQEKTVDITENGTHEITPDDGYALSKVTVNVEVEGGGSSEFPEGYTRCDYIQFTGTQFIDSGIVGTQDTQINTSFTWESSTQRHLYGCASSDNKASITSYMNGSWRFGNKTATKAIAVKDPLIPYGVLVNKTTIAVTASVTKISEVNDFETVGSLLIGGARDSDGTLPNVGMIGKIFYFNMWQGETQLLKLVPVTNGTMYRFFDLISKRFFDSITETALEGGNL